ncbi:MAG: serine/threonine-protein kinase [Planctomycetes bacterium]|jgi:serine/threonine protein kinase|nr:serine/threonine-protein kinase [Planctomycetota bacterium]
MAATDENLLRQLFDRALDLTGTARDEFLASACGADAALRARLQVLLAGAEDAHFLAAPPGPSGDERFEAAGTRIGPYELLERIGEGGFGRVFLAEQRQPVARRVALKIVKVGMDTHQVISRFEQERQALAMMDHPHIARVLDAGTTATGRPYFVMELVSGRPLVQFCDQERLSIEQRLELFDQVCRAVQHAHGKGVIHRDLKPSNVLVARHDGRPHAKVIDFGIAKAIGPGRADDATLTAEHQVLGTLQYMSPEQAAGSADVDTRADVWSLGAVLYELLTGTTPVRREELSDGGLDQLRRTFAQYEPPRPSTRIRELHDAATTADHRSVEPGRLVPRLRGDLDWIVMKAIERDRGRRYATVDGLAADIAAHLAGEPVTAAPPSASYRLRKLVRRHAAAVASGLAVLLALLAGLLAFAWQASVAADERDHARQAQREADHERNRATQLAASEAEQRQEAERSAATAAAINDFLLTTLGAANVRELGHDATVAQALDRAAKRVDATFADQPEVAVAVHHVLARSFLSLGRIDAAGTQLDAVEPILLATFGAASAEAADWHSLRGEWSYQRGDLDAAEAAQRRALEIATTAVGGADSKTLAMQLELGNTLCARGRLDAAEPLLVAGRTGLLAALGPDHPDTRMAHSSLAVLRQAQGRLDDAAALLRTVIADGTRTQGAGHVDVLTARMNLASVLMAQGDKAAALPELQSAYSGLQAAYGEQHTTTALAAWQLAVHLYDEGYFDRAQPLLQHCVEIRTKAHGAGHESTGKALELLALSTSRNGEPAAALPHFDAAVAAFTASCGEHDTKTLTVRVHRANALVRADRKAEGERELLALADLCAEHLGREAPTTIIATNSYAVLLLGLDRHADAIPFLERALTAGRRSPEADPRDTVITQLNLVSALREIGQLDRAARLGDEAVEELLQSFGADHPTTAAGRAIHAETLRRRQDLPAAKQQLELAVASRRRTNSDDNPGHGNDAIALGRVLVELREHTAAAELFAEVADSYQRARGAEHRLVSIARAELGHLRGLQQRFGDGQALLLEAEARLQGQLPRSRRDLTLVHKLLTGFYTGWHAAEPSPERAAAAASWRQRVDQAP